MGDCTAAGFGDATAGEEAAAAFYCQILPFWLEPIKRKANSQLISNEPVRHELKVGTVCNRNSPVRHSERRSCSTPHAPNNNKVKSPINFFCPHLFCLTQSSHLSQHTISPWLSICDPQMHRMDGSGSGYPSATTGAGC